MSRLQRFAVWVLQPKVGLPLALLLCLAASPFVYRATRLTGLPDCGHPFDVEAFRSQEVPDAENAFDTLLPVVQAARDFARLARLEGARLEEAGDLDAAWGWYLVMFRSSRHVGKRGSMVKRLVGMAIHGIASQATATWARHDELTPDQLRRAINYLEEAYAMTAPASVAYRCEYLSSENNIGRFPLSEFGDIEVGEIELFLRNEPEVGRRVMR